jgi:hypothetical protein
VTSDIVGTACFAEKNVPGDILLYRLQSQKQQASTFLQNNQVINAENFFIKNPTFIPPIQWH